MRHRIPSVRAGKARGALRPEGVALAWARDREGRMTPVAALDAASRRARAPFACPGCGDELVARLGAVRARHFAHRPGSACPLTSPETALHFNVKARLLALCGDAFAGAREVTLRTRCPGCRRADPRPLGALGDAAVEEGAVGALRADVLVTRRGAPALALEVLVTHAVDAAKAAALEAAAVPMIEIDAREDWEAEAPGARPGRLAPVEVAVHRSAGFPPCPACRTEARAEVDRGEGGEAAEIAELEAYRARGLLPANTTGRRRGGEGELWDGEVARVTAGFRCPECGEGTLLRGKRLLRHPCPKTGLRPVAWLGYDGRLAELAWWKK